MKSQVGPVAKELKSLGDTEAFLAKEEVAVIYFGGEGSLKGRCIQTQFLLVRRASLYNN